MATKWMKLNAHNFIDGVYVRPPNKKKVRKPKAITPLFRLPPKPKTFTDTEYGYSVRKKAV